MTKKFAVTGSNAVQLPQGAYFDTTADYVSFGDLQDAAEAAYKKRKRGDDKEPQGISGPTGAEAEPPRPAWKTPEGKVDVSKFGPKQLHQLQKRAKRKVEREQIKTAQKLRALNNPKKAKKAATKAERRAVEAERRRRKELILAGLNPLEVPPPSSAEAQENPALAPPEDPVKAEKERKEQRKLAKKERKAHLKMLKNMPKKERDKRKSEERKAKHAAKLERRAKLKEIMAAKGIPIEALNPRVPAKSAGQSQPTPQAGDSTMAEAGPSIPEQPTATPSTSVEAAPAPLGTAMEVDSAPAPPSKASGKVKEAAKAALSAAEATIIVPAADALVADAPAEVVMDIDRVPEPIPKSSKKNKKASKAAAPSVEATVVPAERAPAPATTEETAMEATVAPEPAAKASKKSKASKAASTSIPQASVSTATSSAFEAEVSNFLTANRITYEPPEVGTSLPPYLKFADLKVAQGIQNGLKAFEKPTPIQSAVWPLLLSGRDVIGIAETGSGKTLGFGLPALQHLQSFPSKSVSCLVIAPTRELAMQTDKNLSEIGEACEPPIKTLCLFGGVDKKPQVQALKKSHPRIVVGTPGRLLDLANDGNLKLGEVSYLVLDEADRMLDKGFENDIRSIIKLCLLSASASSPFTLGNPSTVRLTAMFSATWPASVRRLAQDFLYNPARVTVGSDELAASGSVAQTVIVLDDGREKERLLLDHLRSMGFHKTGKGASRDKCLVFALYKKEAQRLLGTLQRKGFEVGCLEGDMSQAQRTEALADFRAGKTNVLVATDVAARGLDISNVEAVFNVTFPLTIEDYIHRIGRTGRAGRKGQAITFFTETDKAHAGELMRVLKDSGNPVPDEMNRFPTSIKKASHHAFGAHFREIDPMVKPTKTVFS